MVDGLKDSESAVIALTREIPNYAERLAGSLQSPITELWGIVLAATGRMTYVATATPLEATATLGVVDAELSCGTTRLRLWRDALRLTVDILDDPESSFRTGFNTRELRSAIDLVFRLG